MSNDQVDRAQVVAELWTSLLGKPLRGDGEDHFFKDGGHSLLAAQFCARASEATGVALSLREFFRSPTLRHVVSRVEGGREPG